MAGESKENPHSVSSLVSDIKLALETRFSKTFVEGEISSFKLYPSGHAYFTLKDAGAQIQCVMFKSALARCKAAASLKDGAKIIVYANVSMYPQKGSCQLVVLAAKPVGEGDLMQRYLELKARLGAEGLFDPAKKRPLPFLPRRIGLVTSEAGAVVHDMCRVLTRRFPAVEIRLFPASVQGVDAPATLTAGLRYFAGCAEWRADIVIVARGGGSFEDLFPFNDETLVRTVAASPIPVISAVGHETDFTLCDFAADVRAGTPSIAAEIAVPELRELVRKLDKCASSLVSSLRGKYEYMAQRVDGAYGRMASALKLWLVKKTAKVDALSQKLDMLSPFAVLARGYSITVDGKGAVVKSPDALSPGDMLVTTLANGSIVSTFERAGTGDTCGKGE